MSNLNVGMCWLKTTNCQKQMKMYKKCVPRGSSFFSEENLSNRFGGVLEFSRLVDFLYYRQAWRREIVRTASYITFFYLKFSKKENSLEIIALKVLLFIHNVLHTRFFYYINQCDVIIFTMEIFRIDQLVKFS